MVSAVAREDEWVNKINILCDHEFSLISGARETESHVKEIISVGI